VQKSVTILLANGFKAEFLKFSCVVSTKFVFLPQIELRRSELEILLSVFDQRKVADNEHHILNVNEQDFPDKYRAIIRKLQEATQSPEIKKKMQLEDGIIEELEDNYREIEELELIVESVKQENELLKQERDATILRMRSAGMSDEDISKFLGVSLQELSGEN
jgi:hypothetical protein